MTRSWAVALLFVGALRCASSPAPAPEAAPSVAAEDAAVVSAPPVLAADVVGKDDRIAPGFRVRVVCSETESRTAIAILEWQAPPAAFATEQRIDFTVYKDGFQRGWFATLPMTRGEARMSEGLRTMERERKAAWANVTVGPAVQRPGFERTKDTVALEVRNVESGILYRWRIAARTERGWRASQEVKVEIPVCVDDRDVRN